MCIFTLFSVFSASLAWFEMIKKVDETANNMPVSDIYGKFKQVTFHELEHKSIDEDEDDCSFSFNKTPVGTISYDWHAKEITRSGTTSISLDDYQLLDQYHPVLLLIQLQKQYTALTNGDISVSADATDSSLQNAKDFLGQKVTHQIDENTEEIVPKYQLDDSSIYTTISNKNYYWMSSVSRFFAQPFDTNGFTTLSSGEYYNFTLGDMQESHFVNIQSSTETFTFNPEVTIYSANQNDNVEYIAVIIDYYPDAVESVYSTFLGNAILENANYELDYRCDWSMGVL